MPPEWNACARQSRVCPCYTTWCAPIIRCRSASLAVVRPNHRLSKHSTMRRASAMLLFRTQSAAEKTSLAPHDSKARLLDMSKRRDSWRSHVHRTRLRSACSSSSLRPAMCGVEGEGPSSFLLGDLKGDILFCEREYPPLPAPLAGTQGFSVCLDKQFQSWYAEHNKGSEKEAFSFHPLKRGDGRCKSLRNGKGGAFEPRGGNAAPVPPLQGNEVPRIQRGIQVEPRTMICSP